MIQLFVALAISVFLHASAHAADNIRISAAAGRAALSGAALSGIAIRVVALIEWLKLNRGVPYSEIFDLSMLKEAQRELAIK